MTDRQPGMSMIVRTVTRWLKGPILLFGIYIVLYGHITPGGGFGGGVIIASAFILVMLALGARHGMRIFSRDVASRLDSAGLLLFLVVGWLGTWFASRHFFNNFVDTPEQAYFSLFSGGVMPLMNLALGLKVASALFLVFTVLTALRIVHASYEERHLDIDDESRGWVDHVDQETGAQTARSDGPSPAEPALTKPRFDVEVEK